MNLEKLRPHFQGEILTPASPGYDNARRIWNGMIDRRPAAIASCTGPADVVAAVRFAAGEDLHPAVRAGGHNVAGLATLDEGLVIDVSPMKGIRVDPAAHTATAQTGLTWREFDRETQVHGLATTGGLVSATGIAGLTLGGGVGWLMGRCGLACDNTLEYDVVTAGGELIRVDAQQHPDLFWALKGGGGNFGVVTSITYRMYPITTVISGMLLYPLARGREVLRRYRDFVEAGLPDELTVYAGATSTPDGLPVVAIMPNYCGSDLEQGERLLEPSAPVRTADCGPCGAHALRRCTADVGCRGAATGIRSYWKACFLSGLPDDAIETFVQFAERCTSPRTFMILENAHGAVGRVVTGGHGVRHAV